MKPFWLTFLIRVLLATPFLVIFFTVSASLLSPFFLVIAALILARPVCELIVDSASGLFTSSARFDRPQPVYSIPQARRAEGKFEEAMTGFEALISKHPEEVHAYVEMIEIAVKDLHDTERARDIYERGQSALKDASKKAALATLYRGITAPSSDRPRTLLQSRGHPPWSSAQTASHQTSSQTASGNQ